MGQILYAHSKSEMYYVMAIEPLHFFGYILGLTNSKKCNRKKCQYFLSVTLLGVAVTELAR